MNPAFFLLIAAFICFVISFFMASQPPPRFNQFIAAGLAFLAVAYILASHLRQ